MQAHLLVYGFCAGLLATPASGARLEVSAAAARNAPCSAALTDGRSLITGGGESPLADTQYFAPSGSMLPADSMLEARSSHICVGLPDNTVLVAGGIGAENLPTHSAELFHPDTGHWTSTGGMLAARTAASAVLLADGRVLVVGGQADGRPANSLEIYDPPRGRFEPVAGILSVPRKTPALATLDDGRVLVAGGTGPGGIVLDTTDIFDPATDRILPGPRMLSPRSNFSAVRLLDGRVLVAGGTDGSSDLASAEIFDPQRSEFSSTAPLGAARQGGTMVVIPNNGRVLIAGGFAGREPLDQAEYFVPWRGVFEPAVPSPAREGSEVVRIGRLSSTGKLLSTTAYSSPAIFGPTDPNQSSGGAVLSGAGWQPGEQVALLGHAESVTADSHGKFTVTVARDPEHSGAPAYVFFRGAAGEAGARF